MLRRAFLPSLLSLALLATSAPLLHAQNTPTVSVDARLVVVPVTVRDIKEKLLLSLTKDDFTLTADGKPQTIRYFDRADDTPLTFGLMVDVSGSQRSVMDAERSASSTFLDSMLQAGRDQAFVVQFGRQADLLADVTGSSPKLEAALKKIDSEEKPRPQFGGDDSSGQNDSRSDRQEGSSGRGGYGGRGGRHGGGGGPRRGAGGGTVLYDAVYLASTEVLPKPSNGKPAALNRRALILLTDGDDRGSRETVTEAIEAAQRADTAIYAIYYKGDEDRGPGGFPGGRGGFPGGRGGFPGGGGRMGDTGQWQRNDGKRVLERMCGETGGRMYEVTKKMTLPQIYKAIGDELRNQYRLGFTPANNDEGYHRLVVDTPHQKKAVLQFRDGYYTGAAAR